MERCHAAIVIGRIMHAFSQNAFLNFHGENCARLTFEQTIHGWEYIPSMSMFFLTPLLFLEPVTQVQELHRIFADSIARTSRWNAFSSKLKGQLHDSNLLATVLLNANVGFLAINTVDRGGRSAIQMASYMSLVTSLGSIVLGLLFVSHDRTSGESTADEAASFLSMLYDKRHGLEKLAIIYSLPKAFLIWGMVFFFVAFSIDWWTSGDSISRAVVGAVILVVFLMIAGSIVCTREIYLRWPTNPLHRGACMGLLSRLANVWPWGVGFIKRAQRDGGDEPEIDLTPTGRSQANTETMHSASRSTISSSSISITLSAANSPRQLDDGDPTFLSPHSHTNLNFTSGGGSSQHTQGDISQYQLTTEVHSEPDHASLRVHLTTSSLVDEQLHSGSISTDATILSEYEEQTPVVPTDTDAVSPDPLHPDSMEGANYTENVVNEPQELESPQRRESITPPPMIFARGATGDDFYHASSGCQVDATIQS
ncbi:hypothetical protein M405DRAFT_326662 [Rhizopogon salebrosus TDB-379]|nr:hypothetical protein M405DRAFT_326662 [Rhizopogon salebrosus TDB-379]